MKCYHHEHTTDEKEWIVNIKGGWKEGDFEISVLRSTNCHGRDSYGWFDKDKMLISACGASHIPITESIWDKLIKVAKEVCFELNDCENLLKKEG